MALVGKVQNVGVWAEPKGEYHHFHAKEVFAGKILQGAKCSQPVRPRVLSLCLLSRVKTSLSFKVKSPGTVRGQS